MPSPTPAEAPESAGVPKAAGAPKPSRPRKPARAAKTAGAPKPAGVRKNHLRVAGDPSPVGSAPSLSLADLVTPSAMAAA